MTHTHTHTLCWPAAALLSTATQRPRSTTVIKYTSWHGLLVVWPLEHTPPAVQVHCSQAHHMDVDQFSSMCSCRWGFDFGSWSFSHINSSITSHDLSSSTPYWTTVIAWWQYASRGTWESKLGWTSDAWHLFMIPLWVNLLTAFDRELINHWAVGHMAVDQWICVCGLVPCVNGCHQMLTEIIQKHWSDVPTFVRHCNH